MKKLLISVILAVCGLYLLCMTDGNFSIGKGDIFTILCALAFSLQILSVDHFAPKVDCVKLALHTVVPRRPDVVIGGINNGDNSSVNVHYSGTMGVVIEGCLKGISSIGYSLCNHFADAMLNDFYAALCACTAAGRPQ